MKDAANHLRLLPIVPAAGATGENLPPFVRYVGITPEKATVSGNYQAVQIPAEFEPEVREKGLWEPRSR